MSSQEKVANSLGVDFLKIILEENVTDDDVINEIHKLNDDVNVQGIMLQLPLPKHLNEKR